jgi:hypothetical protein
MENTESVGGLEDNMAKLSDHGAELAFDLDAIF